MNVETNIETQLCANCANPETGTGLCDECEAMIEGVGLSCGPEGDINEV